MSINKYSPHIIMIPEDRANREIAVGFTLSSNANIQVENEVGGWLKVIERFNQTCGLMEKYKDRFVILLLDLDNDIKRIAYIKNLIPHSVCDRVFIISVLSEPEDLRKELKKNFEEIGKRIFIECTEEPEESLWNSNLLIHNLKEIKKLKKCGCSLY